MGRPRKSPQIDNTPPEEPRKFDNRGRPLKGQPHKAPKNTDITKLAADAIRNPGLTLTQLGKLHNIDHSAVIRLFQRHNIQREHSEDYKAHRADLFAGVQERVLASITDEDINKASIRDRTILVGTLYDKERLERGQSTQNVATILASAVVEAGKQWEKGSSPHVDNSDTPLDIVVEAECETV